MQQTQQMQNSQTTQTSKEVNIFEQAVIKKVRFPSNRGELTLEQLYDLPLTSRTGFDLDTVAKTVNAELRLVSEESFVVRSKGPAEALLSLKLDLVKAVITSRLEAQAEAKNKAQRAEKRQKLLEALASKEDVKLLEMSTEEIQAELQRLAD